MTTKSLLLIQKIKKCPEGTITTRRSKEHDVLTTSSVKRYGKMGNITVLLPKSAECSNLTSSTSGHQHGITYVEGDKYYGAKKIINFREPKIQQQNGFSLSQIWLFDD